MKLKMLIKIKATVQPVKASDSWDRKGDDIMPLSMVSSGEPMQIKRIGGKEEVKKFLENLGFVTGGIVTVVSDIGGSVIVNVRDSRVAIGRDMANKIMV